MGRFDQLIQKHQFPDQNLDEYDWSEYREQTRNTTDQIVTSVKDIVTSILNENVTSTTTTTTTTAPLLEISSVGDMIGIQETTSSTILDESQQSNRTMLEIGQNTTSFKEILENTTKNLNEMFATNNTISMETTPSTVTVLEEITGNNTGIVANTSVNTIKDSIVTTTDNILSTIESDIITTTIDTVDWNNTEHHNYYGLDTVEDHTLYIVVATILAIAIAVIIILILIYRKYRQSSRHSRQLYCVTNLQEISVSNENCKPQYLHQN